MSKKRPKTTRRFKMNVAKNWALLLTEQMTIPVKKNGKQRWSYRRKIDRF